MPRVRPPEDTPTGRLLPTQEALFALHHRWSAPSVLNMTYALGIRGPLREQALERALERLLARHEPLRSGYALAGGVPSVRVAPPCDLPLQRVDLSRLDADERALQVASIASAEAARSFDLATPPMLRVRLLRCDRAEHVLLMTFHHIAVDAWALDVFGRECTRLYQAELRGEEADLPVLAHQCDEVARGAAAWGRSAAAAEERRWWRARLVPAGPIAARHDAVGQSSDDFHMRYRALLLPQPAIERWKDLLRRGRATPFMGMLAVLGTVLARASGTDEVRVATLVSNRHGADALRLLGAHYDATLLRLRLAHATTLVAALEQASAETLRVLKTRLSFAELAAMLGAAADGGGPAVPQCLLVFDRYPLHQFKLEGVDVTPFGLPAAPERNEDRWAAVPTADLVFFVREGGGRYLLSVFWDPRRIEAVDGVIGAFLETLRLFGDAPETHVGELPSPRDPATAARAASAEGVRRGSTCRPMTDVPLVDALSPLPHGRRLTGRARPGL